MSKITETFFEKLWAGVVKWLVKRLDLDEDGTLTWKDAKVALDWLVDQLSQASETPGWADKTLIQKLDFLHKKFMANFKGYKDWAFLLLEQGAWLKLKLRNK